MPIYDSVNGVARKVVKKYDGVNGVARQVTKVYDGVNGVSRQTFSDGVKPSGWFTFCDDLNPIDLTDFFFRYSSGLDIGVEFPFTSLDGASYDGLYIYDAGAGTIISHNYSMYFGIAVPELVYSINDFWNSNYYGWKNPNYKSIYLDDLKIGEDIQEWEFQFLLAIAYPDNTLSGKPQTYTLEAGRYVFYDDIIDGGLFPYDWNAPAFSISVSFKNDGMNSPTFTKFEYRHYFDMIESFEIDYIKADGTSEEAYNYYYDYNTNTTRNSWVGSNFAVTLLSDVQVSKSVYDWWALNTRKG